MEIINQHVTEATNTMMQVHFITVVNHYSRECWMKAILNKDGKYQVN